jgi:glycosyltransferase involved in cell wall biosynthesis
MSMFLRDTPGRTAIHNEDFFSVAIVSFNRFDRLKHLIDTIHQHADMPFEITVSDDGGALYNDFNFIRDIKDKVSHVAVNLGRNKGLHVNANNAVSLTRSKYCLVVNDDIEILKPFMRKSVNILKNCPYVGSIFLEGSFNGSSPPEHHDAAGILEFCTPDGTRFGCHMYMGAAAPVFRKDYWYEVGGYAEDDIYGDLPFNTKGYLRGYMAAAMTDGPYSRDTDKGSPTGGSEHSSGKFIDVGYANYPKIFGWSVAQQLANDKQRANACSQRNATGRSSGDFNEYGIEGWAPYGKAVISGGNIDWNLLESKYHKRFISEMKRDIASRYGSK